jgi:hypothetical protein
VHKMLGDSMSESKQRPPREFSIQNPDAPMGTWTKRTAYDDEVNPSIKEEITVREVLVEPDQTFEERLKHKFSDRNYQSCLTEQGMNTAQVVYPHGFKDGYEEAREQAQREIKCGLCLLNKPCNFEYCPNDTVLAGDFNAMVALKNAEIARLREALNKARMRLESTICKCELYRNRQTLKVLKEALKHDK